MDALALNESHREYAFLCNSDDVVIFVHGILGSPGQFRFLAEALFEQGFDCKALLLPGHGGPAREFGRSSVRQWQAHFDEAVDRAKDRYKKVFIAGHSLGGLLCLNYLKHSEVAGAVLINTPLVIRISVKQLALGLRVLLSGAEKDDAYLSAGRQAYSITGGRFCDYPVWVRQFAGLFFLARKTRNILGKVKGVVLVVQSGKDESVHRRSLGLLKAGLTHANTQVLELSGSYHDYFPETDRQRLRAAVVEFLHRGQA